MLRFQNVVKRRSSGFTLGPINLELPAGKTLVLLGPSGCGKSTLLRIALDLVPPDEGSVYLGDTRLTHENANALRRAVGYVIQDGGLFPHLTVRKNLALMPGVLGWPTEKTEERIRTLVTLTHFPQAGLNRYPGEISGGQKQRVALMRALMLDPQLLLFDEPLGALDPIIRRELQEELREIFRSLGKSVVIVTHDLAEAGFLGDSIALMRDGRIIQQGTLSALVGTPADPFVTRFVNAQRGPLETVPS